MKIVYIKTNNFYTDNDQGECRIKGWKKRPAIRLFSYSVFWLFSLIILLFGFSCTSDEVEKVDKPGEVTTLTIPVTRSGNEAEDKMTNCRMIIFSKGTSARVLYNEKHTEAEGGTFTAEVPVGNIDIYLIANEQSGWLLDDVTSLQQLKGKALSFSTYPVVDATHPIPMFGVYENIYAAPNNATVLSQAVVKRLYAKVTLDLSCAFEKLGGTEIVLEHAFIGSLPAWSKLWPTPYDNTGSELFIEGGKITPSSLGANYNATQSRDGKDGFSAMFTFYVPEYLVSNTDYRSYLGVAVYQKDDTSNKKTYKVILGDGIAEGQPGHNNNTYMASSSATLTDLSISRNRHYTFTATIEDFSASEMNLIASVSPWGSAPMSTIFDGQHYLTLSKDSIMTGIEDFSTSLTIKTNYNRTDLGYNKGIYITDTDKLPTGVTISGGADGDLERNITITGATILPTGTTRTGFFTISAGNLKYTFRIERNN